MEEKIIELVTLAITNKDIKIEVDSDAVKFTYKTWNGYNSISALYSYDFVGYGFVSLDELKQKVLDYINK